MQNSWVLEAESSGGGGGGSSSSSTHTIARSPMAMSRDGGKFLGRLVENDDSGSKPNCSNTTTFTSQS